MNFLNTYQPSDSSPETEQAQRILVWFERRLVPLLSPAARATYQKLRQIQGPIATTNRGQLFHGGPTIPIPHSAVSGCGDDAYGHNRVIALIDKLVLPMIENNELDSGLIYELKSLCRGNFANQYRAIERSVAQQQTNHS